MDIAQPMKFTVDINKGLLPQPQRTVLKQGDANANRVIVAMKDGDKPYDITGVMVTGAFLRPPNGDRVDLTGEANGNEASVLLTGQCYEIEGQYELDVILHYADARRTVLAIDGYVENRGSGEIVITGTVQGIDELLAQIDAMKAATADGLAAAQEARAAGGEAKATAEAAGDEAKNTANAAAEYAREQGASAANAAGTASAAAALANTGANTANLAATNANNAIAGLDEKISAGVEKRIAQITDGSADMAEVVSARTDEDGVVHTSLKMRLDDGFGLLKATKASAILDESARAASHELYAQRESPLGVTLHGYTYQEGEGDPSPENVRPIHGLEAAQVRAGGKNLAELMSISSSYVTIGNDGKLAISKSTTSGASAKIETNDIPIAEGLKIITRNDSGRSFIIKVRTKAGVDISSDHNVPTGALDSLDLSDYAGRIIGIIYIWLLGGETENVYEGTASVMLTYSDDTAYEPYLATTADLPLLPDGSPLMEGDTVENWVRSGGDVRKVISSADDLTLENFDASKNVVYSDTTAAIAVIDGVITTSLTYPTTVYYRSTDYTPDKDLRVCRVVRRLTSTILDGSEEWTPYIGLDGCYFTDLKQNGYISSPSVISEEYTYAGGTPSVNVGKLFVQAGFRLVFSTNYSTTESWKERLMSSRILVVAKLTIPEIYMTDPLPLLPPAALESETVTVTGSGETEVEYAHDTKHYIDSQIAAAVALALNG